MNKKRQREIASMGGSASSGNFKNDREKASRAGKTSRRGSNR
jgi:general stress protein YciG